MRTHLSTVVLAGGKGRRLADVTGGVPKQFWRPPGHRSFLEATLARTAPLSPPERTFVIVDRTHKAWMDGLPQVGRMARAIYQPHDRGTASGVLLGLVHVRSLDPNAMVLLTPADHGIGAEHVFRQGICEAVTAIRRRPAAVALFGATPASASVDYGWISPGTSPEAGQSSRLRAVQAFVEKPASEVAERLFRTNAVWNTMVLVARAGSLLALFDRHLPAVSSAFAAAHRSGEERVAPASIYEQLPAADFSRDVLSHASGLSLYTWPASLGWSDLGTPDRWAAWHTAAAERTAMPPRSGTLRAREGHGCWGPPLRPMTRCFRGADPHDSRTNRLQ